MPTTWTRRIAIPLFGASLFATACGPTVERRVAVPGDAPEELELRLELAADLKPFDTCEDLLRYFQDNATDHPEFLPAVPIGGDTVVDSVPGAAGGGSAGISADSAQGGVAESAPALPVLDAPQASEGGGAAFSTTNIQEAGVDEPDFVKTDGKKIVIARYDDLLVVDTDTIRLLGSVELPEGGSELFLDGDRAIVLTRSWQVPNPEEPGTFEGGTADAVYDYALPGVTTTVVTAFDLTDPAHPRVVDQATFEGDYVTARLSEGVVRLVLRSSPTLVGDPEANALDAWLPQRLDGGGAGTDLVACDAVSRPPEPSGVGTVTVLTIDAGGSMTPIDTDAVVADAQTIYASTETLFVATNQWEAEGGGSTSTSTTEIHAFDISSPDGTSYVASGRVRGQLLSQWSLSEHKGDLRVATTDGSPWATAPGGEPSSESYLTVLRTEGSSLVAVGSLGGLGKGETIHAVRFLGDVGFVVTFRQTDPLYALDLSDPTTPRLMGELKVPGYSAYLHPVGDDRLLGVGQDATDEGFTTGTQVSLFDISDLADLRRLDNATIPGADSIVESDHRAFLWWAARDLAVIPIENCQGPVIFGGEPVPEEAFGSDVGPDCSLGIAAFRASGNTVDEVGFVSQQHHDTNLDCCGDSAVERALVIDDRLLTVSMLGVMASDLDTFEEEGWAALPS
ncbi:MAG: beta-propeller domain-containing protein [Actinobacteria bacterium]|nr:beta-propeller domain-containing protein [Actinomycetota bacterium]